MVELALADKVTALARAFETRSIPYAFGGALALAYYAEPRATIDIDVNVFVDASHYDDVRELLAGLGIGRLPAKGTIERDGQGRAHWGRTPVDLFFASDPVHDAMEHDARSVPFGADEIMILAPEHIVVAKVVFDRPKDWLDIEQVLVAVAALGLDEIRRWLRHLVGEADPRAARFETTVVQMLGSEHPT